MGRDVSTFGRLRTYFLIKNRQIAAVRLLNASACQPVSSLLAMKTIESLQSCEMSNPSPPTLEDPDLVKMSEDDEIVKIKNEMKEDEVQNGSNDSDSEKNGAESEQNGKESDQNGKEKSNGDETIQIDSEDSDQNEKIDSKDEESNLENGNDNSTDKE